MLTPGPHIYVVMEYCGGERSCQPVAVAYTREAAEAAAQAHDAGRRYVEWESWVVELPAPEPEAPVSDKTELPTVKERCQTCRYWEPDPDGPAPECRRRAPVYGTETLPGGRVIDTFKFPSIEAEGWCGEWRPEAVGPKTAEDPDILPADFILPGSLLPPPPTHGRIVGQIAEYPRTEWD